MDAVSTPNARTAFRAASPSGFAGSFVTNDASSPKFASETATFASAPA